MTRNRKILVTALSITSVVVAALTVNMFTHSVGLLGNPASASTGCNGSQVGCNGATSTEANEPKLSGTCSVATHNVNTVESNNLISTGAIYTSNYVANVPEITVTLTASGEDFPISGVTVIGYDVNGTETGSATADINQVIANGQSMTFTQPEDSAWYSVAESNANGDPTVYSSNATTCQIANYS